MNNQSYATDLENGELSIEALYTSYRSRLLSVIGRYVRCPNEREDVLHDVFLRVHRALPDFRGDAALYTWLYRIAVNTSLNHIRKVSYRSTLLNDDERAEPADVPCDDDPESLAIADESAQRIVTAMATLEWSHKGAFLLHCERGLSYEAIAKLLKCPIGTVRSRISRTRRSLREGLEVS